ncbi:MAG: hypothetical protein IJH40_08565 [Ruminococcus sp.]|uniref:FtsK/SpoIIIE domain-containing protein n=1 Tax=Ruminococcus sp. TaxID=41978 RepID=UPI002873DE6B|nr:FtsK/SpoIIIE domain-containing protein [Ruminococcus sp.]MBQ3285678.1 hypothetical protein [Ruminococcus sp.]
MSSLIEQYNNIIKRLNELNNRIAANSTRIAEIRGELTGNIPSRIQHLEEQIQKIDDYMLKILGFQDLAKQHMTSMNALTIEAPPGYRVNLNRLRNWAMMIDPTSADDPYAQRVYLVAKCDEFFLKKKRAEFETKIEELRKERDSGLYAELEQLKEESALLTKARDEFTSGTEFSEFADAVYQANMNYWFEQPPAQYIASSKDKMYIAPGAYAASLGLSKEQLSSLKGQLGQFLDLESGRILLPLELPADKEYVISVEYAPSRRVEFDRALQNLILNTLRVHPLGSHKIYMLDASRYNSRGLGSLRQLENSFSLEPVPRNSEQLTTTLENLVSYFSDIDEIIGSFDTVSEYNASVSPELRLPTSTVILYGWTSLSADSLALAERIMTGYERYGVSIIAVSYANEENQHSAESHMPDYARFNAVNITMLPGKTMVKMPDSASHRFTWYTFSGELGQEYVNTICAFQPVDNSIGNEYTKRYSLNQLPEYIREYKKIVLPFGIDGKDEAHTLSFEDENFAAYLVGASRSGKSTLLHTLIAGLIRNYHPDNLELWLADFKQLEFKRYMKHLPPHVKYILLDESTELVYDLIDRLTDKMMERQRLFARLGVQRIDQIDPRTLSEPLPVIFVILDEFSIMSQSIAESQIYKLRLQNILAKGAALGIKFLFASQTFTTGVAGLTPTARAQIQQRIAMKGSRDEISETLELSAALRTEQVKSWMDALPPHYALVKFRTGPDTPPQVKRFLVMYFADYAPRDEMIELIKDRMTAEEMYQPARLDAYVDKHPVLVDGNNFDMFDPEKLKKHITRSRASANSGYAPDDRFISFGTPRLMVDMKTAVLSSETRENLLVLARSAEQAPAASIALSAMKSYRLQNGRVQIWAYPKNRLYSTYKDVFVKCGFEIIEGMDAVCDAIYELKQDITAKKSSDVLIVLMGIDRICMDFDYVDAGAAKPQEKKTVTIAELDAKFTQSGAIVQTEEEEKKHQLLLKWTPIKRKLRAQAKAEGKTKEEIDLLLKEELAKLRVEMGMEVPANSTQPASTIDSAKADPEDQKQEETEKPAEHQPGAYNAAADFVYVVKQGSRLGYHFMLNLSSPADLKATGLKKDFFRYKMAFQLSIDDSRDIFNTKIASGLPEHICQFDDTIEQYSFRPYLHSGVSWDGWYVSDTGEVVSPFE